jgi:hypothetical protein
MIDTVKVQLRGEEYKVHGLWTGDKFILGAYCPVKGIPRNFWEDEANRIRGLKEEASVDFEEVNCPFPEQI